MVPPLSKASVAGKPRLREEIEEEAALLRQGFGVAGNENGVAG